MIIFTEISFMEAQAQTAEAELLHYWQKLTALQKDSVVNLLKSIVSEAVETHQLSAVPQEQWDKINKEREAHLAGSKSFTWKEVKEMARNKEKRYGLSSGD